MTPCPKEDVKFPKINFSNFKSPNDKLSSCKKPLNVKILSGCPIYLLYDSPPFKFISDVIEIL